ncbi:amidohydrolase family protein [Streptomyces chartreusis]|uniref:amidohydrolase family protein n=1 Tax=Streptomyces chartreusis TaxID=1969 RepID=UPI0036CE8A8F
MTITIYGVLAITMDESLETIDQCDIVIADDGRIQSVGPTDGAPRPADEMIDGTGLIAIPGLIDTHRHSWLEMFRGLTADLPVGGYRQLTKSGIAQRVHPDAVHLATLVGDLAAVDCGITTVADLAHIGRTADHLDASVQGHRDSGLRVVLAHTPANGDGENWYVNSERRHPADIAWLRTGALADDDALVVLAMGARPLHCVTPEVLQADVATARDLGLRLIYDGAGAATGGGPVRRRWSQPGHRTVAALAESGLLGPDMGFVHGNHLEDDELGMIADHGAGLSVASEVEMLCGYGLPVCGRDAVAGLRLALSTDVAAYADPSILTAMRTMLMLSRARPASSAYLTNREETTQVPAVAALRAGTIDGARFLGLQDRIGTLSPGRAADIVLIDRTGPRLAAVRDPAVAVVLFAQSEDVRHVMVQGRIVKRDGRLVEARRSDLVRRLVDAGSAVLAHGAKRAEDAPLWNF